MVLYGLRRIIVKSVYITLLQHSEFEITLQRRNFGCTLLSAHSGRLLTPCLLSSLTSSSLLSRASGDAAQGKRLAPFRNTHKTTLTPACGEIWARSVF